MKKLSALFIMSVLSSALLCACSSHKASPTGYSFSELNFGQSVAQIEKAADKGDPSAQYALGYMYYYGEDVNQDYAKAAMWIRRSAGQGYAKAEQALSLIGKDEDHVLTALPAGGGSATADGYQKHATHIAKTETDQTAESTEATAQAAAMKIDSTTASAAEPMIDTTTASAADKTTDTITANATDKATDATTASAVARATDTTAAIKSDSNRYGLQLMGAYRHSELVDFVRRHHLEGQVTYGQTTYNGKPWYVALYGRYPTRMHAELAINHLPHDLKDLHPWVRSFRDVS